MLEGQQRLAYARMTWRQEDVLLFGTLTAGTCPIHHLRCPLNHHGRWASFLAFASGTMCRRLGWLLVALLAAMCTPIAQGEHCCAQWRPTASCAQGSVQLLCTERIPRRGWPLARRRSIRTGGEVELTLVECASGCDGWLLFPPPPLLPPRPLLAHPCHTQVRSCSPARRPCKRS